MIVIDRVVLICAALLHFAWAGSLRGLQSSSTPRGFCNDPSCWPDAGAWSQLNATVGGRLEVPSSPVDACIHPADSTEDGQCAEQWSNVHTSPFWTQMWGAGGTQSIGYNGGWLAVPTRFAVVCRSAADIQAAVKFCTDHNVRPIIKGAGHDYLGRSTGPEDGFALTIYTFWMKDMSFDDCAKPELMTLGAGVIWEEAYRFAHEHGRMVIGGGCPSVGAAGGWPMGGGMSDVLGKMVGHGVDNMRAAKIVLANGTLVNASAEENPELFWALRGGGGGTFGVLTELTWQTHDDAPWREDKTMLFKFTATCSGEAPADDFATAMAGIWEWYADVPQRRFGGEIFVATDATKGAISFTESTVITAFNMTAAEHMIHFNKLSTWLDSAANPCQANVTHSAQQTAVLANRQNGAKFAYPEELSRLTKNIPAYSDELPFDANKTEWLLSKWYAQNNQNEVFTFWGSQNSRFVNASEFADPAALAQKFRSLVMVRGAEAFTISLGKAEGVWEDGTVKSIGASGEEVSTHPAVRFAGLFLNGFSGAMVDYNPMIPIDAAQDPAWLRSYLSQAASSACPAAGSDHSGEAEAKCSAAALVDLAAARVCDEVVKRCLDALHDLDLAVGDKLMELWPGMGAYPNEASFFQKDWKAEFWGSNYEKLEKVKREVDPDNLFQCHHCIGSE